MTAAETTVYAVWRELDDQPRALFQVRSHALEYAGILNRDRTGPVFGSGAHLYAVLQWIVPADTFTPE